MKNIFLLTFFYHNFKKLPKKVKQRNDCNWIYSIFIYITENYIYKTNLRNDLINSNFKCCPILGTMWVKTWNTSVVHFPAFIWWNYDKIAITRGLNPTIFYFIWLDDLIISKRSPILGIMWVQHLFLKIISGHPNNWLTLK